MPRPQWASVCHRFLARSGHGASSDPAAELDLTCEPTSGCWAALGVDRIRLPNSPADRDPFGLGKPRSLSTSLARPVPPLDPLPRAARRFVVLTCACPGATMFNAFGETNPAICVEPQNVSVNVAAARKRCFKSDVDRRSRSTVCSPRFCAAGRATTTKDPFHDSKAIGHEQSGPSARREIIICVS